MSKARRPIRPVPEPRKAPPITQSDPADVAIGASRPGDPSRRWPAGPKRSTVASNTPRRVLS